MKKKMMNIKFNSRVRSQIWERKKSSTEMITLLNFQRPTNLALSKIRIPFIYNFERHFYHFLSI